MGEGILKYYQTNIEKEYKIAFLSTFFIKSIMTLMGIFFPVLNSINSGETT